jgi:hypothetical protein
MTKLSKLILDIYDNTDTPEVVESCRVCESRRRVFFPGSNYLLYFCANCGLVLDFKYRKE